MPNCRFHPPLPRPEPFSPLPLPGHVPDWGKWIRDRLAEKGALLAFPSASEFPDPGAQPNVYEALDTGTLYRWDGAHYQVLVDPSAANDVLEYEGRGHFPETGEHGKLYIAADTGSIYRWGGEDYVALLPGKADKCVPAAEGSLAALTRDGNLADSGAKPSDFAAAGAVAAIEEKIPSQASASNQLADKAFVNSSIATNTATFRGTFNLVTDLQLPLDATHVRVAQAIRAALVTAGVDPDDNDYAYVQIPQDLEHTDAMKQVDRYKYTVVGSSQTWAYEWSLNNSSFTAVQWAAINSGMTSADVAKLSALPDASTLAAALLAKVARTELFPPWAANTAYTTYSLVIHENALYKCTTAHTSGAEWDSTKWAVASGAEVLGVLLNYLALSNKPQINGHTLTGGSSQSGDSLGLVDKTGDQTIGGSKTFTGYDNFYDFTVSHPQGQGYVRIYALANENRVHIEFSDGVTGSQGELSLPVLGGYSAVTLAAIENLATDFMPLASDGYVFDENTLCCYQGRLYRCKLGYAFQSGDSYPPDDTTHWALAAVEDVLAALRTAIAGKANASDLPYAISASIPLTVTSGAASTTLDDRTHNVRTVAAPGSGNTTTITATLPPIVAGKSRDMFLNLTVGSAASDAGDISLSIVEPSGATVQIDIGSVEDIGVGENEIMIFERALPTTSGNTTTTHWQVTVRHEDFT